MYATLKNDTKNSEKCFLRFLQHSCNNCSFVLDLRMNQLLASFPGVCFYLVYKDCPFILFFRGPHKSRHFQKARLELHDYSFLFFFFNVYSLMSFETAYTCETITTIKVISLTSKSFLMFLCFILLTFLVRTFHMRSTLLNC